MNWRPIAIDQACSLITDGTHYSPPDLGVGIPFLTVKDMTGDGLGFDSAAHISQEEYEKAVAGNSAPRRGDVLFSKDGTIGKIHVVTEEMPFAVLSSIAILRPRREVLDSSYLGHVLRSRQVLRQAAGSKTGSALTRIILKDLKQVRIPLPPLAEQQRIVAVLDKADGIRRLRCESRRLAEEFLRSAFLEMFGNPVTDSNDSELVRLERVADIVSGVTKGRALRGQMVRQVPYLRVANVQDGYLDLRDVRTIDATPEEAVRYRLQAGDILLTEGGDPDKLGRGAVWRGKIEGCIHQNHIFRVRLADRNLLPDYLSALLGSMYGKRYFLKAAKQTTGIASINRTQLGACPVLRAPLEKQERYASLFASVQRLGDRLDSAAQTTSQLYDCLAQRVFRGEL